MNMEPSAALRKAFPGLPEKDVAELTSVARVRTYPAGTILCHEGRVEDTFYLVVSGQAEVTKQIDPETHRQLARPGPGEFFGEIALVQQSTRTATVRTTQLTTVLEIDRKTFEAVLHRSPRMALQIIRQVTSRLRDTDQKAITELRQKNVELARAYAELEEEQQMRSEFLTTVSHELRTPLTSVNGYLSLLQSGMVPAEQQPEIFETMARNVDTVVHLVNSILFLQELEMIVPDLRDVALGDVVLQAMQKVRQRAEEACIRLQVDVEPGLPLVRGDPTGLERAVTVLLDNAIKFTPGGGDVKIEVFENGGWVGSRIIDPGVGIPAGQLERIFEPFTRVRPEGQLFGGIGLGLPIARHIVELCGGRIEVASEVGKGSTFTILLPKTQRSEPVEGAAKAETAASVYSSS
ncbi:MAG: cyclic nucleotide-binding domain-containing protein [Anaerolineae bacterium]|nr:cyclic nucleotide-binding domain-containing protein [Anaerolineae bacterium]